MNFIFRSTKKESLRIRSGSDAMIPKGNDAGSGRKFAEMTKKIKMVFWSS